MQSNISVLSSNSQDISSSRISGPASEAIQLVDNSQIESIAKQKGINTQELFGTGFCYRHDWGDRNGQWKLTLNWASITRDSKVFVAIGEGAAGGGKFVGAAKYTVHNIAPTDGSVTIWVNIEWSSPIRLYADYFVCN